VINLNARTLFWCWIVNDPFFIQELVDGKIKCPLCKWVDIDGLEENESVSKIFLTQHKFMGYVGWNGCALVKECLVLTKEVLPEFDEPMKGRSDEADRMAVEEKKSDPA